MQRIEVFRLDRASECLRSHVSGEVLSSSSNVRISKKSGNPLHDCRETSLFISYCSVCGEPWCQSCRYNNSAHFGWHYTAPLQRGHCCTEIELFRTMPGCQVCRNPSKNQYLRGTLVNRTYAGDKNLYIYLFLITIFGPIYYRPP